jgi:ATP-dependent Lon protease
MKESAHAALSFLRSRADVYGIEPDFFKDNEIHVHVPAGAIPKDGPSAGVTLATAIASIALPSPVRADVAMTGEITLRGHVLAVGGLREKLLAAARAGIRTVLVPAANEADLVELPANVRRRLRIVPCRTIDDVFREALTKPLGGQGVAEAAPPVPVDAGARC